MLEVEGFHRTDEVLHTRGDTFVMGAPTPSSFVVFASTSRWLVTGGVCRFGEQECTIGMWLDRFNLSGPTSQLRPDHTDDIVRGIQTEEMGSFLACCTECSNCEVTPSPILSLVDSTYAFVGVIVYTRSPSAAHGTRGHCETVILRKDGTIFRLNDNEVTSVAGCFYWYSSHGPSTPRADPARFPFLLLKKKFRRRESLYTLNRLPMGYSISVQVALCLIQYVIVEALS